MRILILGGTGMLGHRLWIQTSRRHDVWVTTRSSPEVFPDWPEFDRARMLRHIDAMNPEDLVGVLARVRPEVVVNCVGLVKQLPLEQNHLATLQTNAVLPQRLAQLCQLAGIRLIQISTDCVFSGRKGNYCETDIPDAEDLYGRSKVLGEVTGPGSLTIRTSMIGRELHGQLGLIEWFISQRERLVAGYTKAVYTGFTTQVLSEIIDDIITQHPLLSGLWHISSDPISKYDLLTLVDEVFELGVTINRDESIICDRSLNSSRFRNTTGYQPPSWGEMVVRMAEDRVPYDELKREHAY
jgi:dTDP-4-dehydrorhamnose reductase